VLIISYQTKKVAKPFSEEVQALDFCLFKSASKLLLYERSREAIGAAKKHQEEPNKSFLY